MSKRELSGRGDTTPEPTLILSREKKCLKGTFEGVYQGLQYDQPVGAFNNKYIHAFTFNSSTLPIELKQGDAYVAVALDPGEKVIVFAGKRLHAALLKAEVGMTIEIEAKGDKLNPKTKRYFHDVIANVIE